MLGKLHWVKLKLIWIDLLICNTLCAVFLHIATVRQLAYVWKVASDDIYYIFEKRK